MVYKEGFETINYIPQFLPEDRQSAFSRVLRFLGENSSFMANEDGKSMVRLGDRNFKSYCFKQFLLITMGSLMWALLKRC